MATQTLEFSAGTGLTLNCKIFALGSNTIVATAIATEKTNDQNRYTVNYTDLPAGAYRLNAFVGSAPGFANEVYDLTLTTATFYPRSEYSTISSDVTSIKNNVDAIKAKTDNLPADPASTTDITSLQNNAPTEAY